MPISQTATVPRVLDTLRLIMMGTGPFAVPTFEHLLQSKHQVVALVTRPNRPAHRREKSLANPMRATAQRSGLAVFEPESINSPPAQNWLRDQGADLLVVCDYGQILSRETLALARLGGINLHASLLPKYRGAAPINWAIYQGEAETGVTVIHMTPQLDAGPILLQRSLPIHPTETAPELELRLARLGVEATSQAIAMLAQGSIAQNNVQNPKLATKAPRLKKEDGFVDWSRSAATIFNQVRALKPWPTTYTFWKRPDSEPLRIILDRVKMQETSSAASVVVDRPPSSTNAVSSLTPKITPGTVVVTGGDTLLVTCGEGMLQIESLQPAGKRTMSAGEFLRGHPLRSGDKFG